MKFLRLTDLDVDFLKNKRVLIRADLNVPLDTQGNISDDSRIQAALPSMRLALAAGARVMVTSHLGRPKEGDLQDADSLRPIAERLGEYLNMQVPLLRDWLDGEFFIGSGELVLLENCRGNLGEKSNDEALSKQMANLCDVYVNDAFATSHRAEATTVGVARFAKVACAGPLMAAELEALANAFANPKRPLVAIVGGSKVSTKLTILNSLADKVDQLIVGGGIANTFLLAEGIDIGRSLSEPGLVGEAKSILKKMHARGSHMPLPTDVACADHFSVEAKAEIKDVNAVSETDQILDIGPDSALSLAHIIRQAGTIVWNGPVGVFEFPAFASGTRVLAKAIAESSAFTIAGGGDTVAAIHAFGVEKQINYISTAGGAFLEFLEGKTLPAVAVLCDRFTNKAVA